MPRCTIVLVVKRATLQRQATTPDTTGEFVSDENWIDSWLDRVREAVSGRSVNLLYTSTVRPFDARTLRTVAPGTDVVLVEP